MKVKYIAAGFLEDAGKLLNDFLEGNSFEFSVFASVWKQHHFSLIFMGRPDDMELTEFTNEIFRITIQFLSSSSVLFQVGAVFLLYSLYRNQISVPPIKIRIEISQWKIIDSLRQEAIAKKYRTLHYVIDYLISDAFIYVAHPTLRGPVIASVQKLSKSSEIISSMKANYKVDLSEYSCSSNLSRLHELHTEYIETKKNLDDNFSKSGRPEIFKEFLGEMEIVLNTSRPSRRGRGRGRKDGTDIGLRRSEIKAAAFSKKSIDFWGRNAESEDSPDSDDDYAPSTRPLAYRRRRAKRVPQHERRVGRPRKVPLPPKETEEEEVEEDIDITHLLKQQEEFYLPPELPERGKIRTVRFPYYKLMPKPDEDQKNNSSV